MSPQSPRASAHLLRRLAEDGIWSRAQADALERELRAQLPWREWIERLLLFLGAALLLAGVIFFFAYNWRDLSPTQKFAVVEGALVLCAVAAWWRGLDTLVGQVLLTAACVLVGVFLAVFGQVYQTGADTYELFTGWALLILPWVLLGRSGALWLLWLVLLNFALVLSWEVAWVWPGSGEADLCALVGVLNAIALAAREFAVRRGCGWLGAGWLRTIPCLAAFGAFTLGADIWIFDHHYHNATHGLPIGMLLFFIALGGAVYRHVLPSLPCLAVIMLSACVVLITFIGRAVLEGAREPIGGFFLMGLVVVGIFGAAAWWLRQIGQALKASDTP